MKLLLLRHATAVPSGAPGVLDEERRLTPRGKRRFRKAARGLARVLARPEALFSSPLVRALETAEIAAKAWGRIRPTPEPLLAGGEPEAVMQMLAGHPAAQATDAVIALVGHEPHVSRLLGHLVGGAGEGLAFKKGGAALIDVLDPGAGPAQLIWFLPPRLLRRLGRE
jgi:phosphohistidine phosphatase